MQEALRFRALQAEFPADLRIRKAAEKGNLVGREMNASSATPLGI